MNELAEKSAQILELPQVLNMLAAEAVCAEAKERALLIRPCGERSEAERLLRETDAACKLMVLQGAPHFGGIRPVGEAVRRAEIGGALNTRELLDVAGVLRAARMTREYGSEDRKEPTEIDYLFHSLMGNRYLEDRIFGAILGEDEIASSASPELADIRRHMQNAVSKVREVLQQIISSPHYTKYLQESIITMRNDRYVVPVKAECKGEVPGLIHDVSSSGATVFVEPMKAVQANNDLRELVAKEKKEIERILMELSAMAGEHGDAILRDYDLLVALDGIFARGKLSGRMNAASPALSRDGSMNLRRARHPLLASGTAVPIDVRLGGDFDTMVITGPNTGGKTVTLKTIGLLCLMAQCGLHIPAGDGSSVAVFSKVLADIGDEQSIEQSLSTFSAHMTNIVRILEESDAQTLILMDELGAGTDPVEGAALAIAIIEEERRRGARIAATTHYAELKVFAMTTPGVVNAACEFDVETLRPTYKLLIGVPGKSNAFAIAAGSACRTR
jgi:DNA mismatch repair protein MutS2